MINLKKINLSYTKVTNQMHKIGKYDMPYCECNLLVTPDYIALYSERRKYKYTENTCVAFYQWDDKFDGIYGLWNCIYYNLENKLKKIKDRFNGVKYAISPDYSVGEDVENFENYYRYAKSRIVSAWLTLECGIVVIPNITFSSEEDFPLMINGIEDVNTIAISLKGSTKKKINKELTIKAINYLLNNLKNLKHIIVYYVGTNIEKCKQTFFGECIQKEIDVIIPNNTLMERNKLLYGGDSKWED